MNDETPNPESEDPLDSLFKGVEKRPQPSPAAREKAFETVMQEWEATQQRRATIIRFTPLALAATVLVSVFAVIMILQPIPTNLQLELAQGHIYVDSLVYRTTYRPNAQPLIIDLEADTLVQAVEATRWRATNGADVRLDGGSTFAWRSANTLSLRSGAVYIETDGASPFVVETSHGVVRDIGTEFIVETDQDRLVVAVREGRVELTTPANILQTDTNEPGSASVMEVNNDGVREWTETTSNARWNWIHIASEGYATANPITMLYEIAKDLGKQLRFNRL